MSITNVRRFVPLLSPLPSHAPLRSHAAISTTLPSSLLRPSPSSVLSAEPSRLPYSQDSQPQQQPEQVGRPSSRNEGDGEREALGLQVGGYGLLRVREQEEKKRAAEVDGVTDGVVGGRARVEGNARHKGTRSLSGVAAQIESLTLHSSS